ncbi:MAG: alpha/beta fold hydrolase [Thermoprotei archaeon]|jgi:pimeloyl-ACP methyl ester carboxylesterase
MDNFTIIDGNKIHYIEEGKGRDVLVLFHGSNFNAMTWVNTGTLQAVSSARFRALSVDFPGYGQSQGERQHLSEFVGKFIKILSDVNRLVLLGASMGGRAVLEYALSVNGKGLSAVILVGAVGLAENAQRLNSLSRLKVLGIWGSEDRISPPDNAKYLELVGGKVRIITGAPHACYLKEPQKFNEILVDFLRTV